MHQATAEQLIQELAAATGVSPEDVRRLADRVARYVTEQYEGVPETAEDLEAGVIAGVMHDQQQMRRMSVRALTRPAQTTGAIYETIRNRL